LSTVSRKARSWRGIIEYPELEGAHKDHRVSTPGSTRSCSKLKHGVWEHCPSYFQGYQSVCPCPYPVLGPPNQQLVYRQCAESCFWDVDIALSSALKLCHCGPLGQRIKDKVACGTLLCCTGTHGSVKIRGLFLKTVHLWFVAIHTLFPLS